jgi:DNA-directed RNA polymerase subunit RPC12/RpoP
MKFELVPLTASGPQTFSCVDCGKRVNQSHEPVYADLSGVPFAAYYCQQCKNKQEQLQEN